MAHEGFDPGVLRRAYDAVAPEYAQKFGDNLDHLPLDTELLDRLHTGAELEHAIAGVGFGDVLVRRRNPLPHERQSGRLYVTATAP